MSRRIDELKRRLRKSPDDLNLCIRLALVYERKGRGREALEQWERVLTLDDSVFMAWIRVARGLLDRGLVCAAAEAYAEGLDLVATAPEGLVRRGLSALRGGAAALRGRAKSVSGRFRRHAADGPETVEKPLDDAALIALWSRAHKLIGQRGLGEAEGVLRELAGLLGSAAPSVGAEGLFHDEGAPRLAATLAASAPLCAALAGAGLVLWLHPRPRLHAPARSAPGRCSAVLWWRARGALDGALVEPAPAGLLALGTALEGPADDWALQEPGGRVMGEGATSAGLIAELSVTVLYAWASSLAGPLVELLIERDEAEQG